MTTVPIEAIAAGLKACGTIPPLRIQCTWCKGILTVPKYRLKRCGCGRIGLDGPPERPRIIGHQDFWVRMQ